MSGRPGEVDRHCKFVPHRSRAQLRRVTRLIRTARFRSKHPNRNVGQAIVFPRLPARQQATVRSLALFARCSGFSDLTAPAPFQQLSNLRNPRNLRLVFSAFRLFVRFGADQSCRRDSLAPLLSPLPIRPQMLPPLHRLRERVFPDMSHSVSSLRPRPLRSIATD